MRPRALRGDAPSERDAPSFGSGRPTRQPRCPRNSSIRPVMSAVLGSVIARTISLNGIRSTHQPRQSRTNDDQPPPSFCIARAHPTVSEQASIGIASPRAAVRRTARTAAIVSSTSRKSAFPSWKPHVPSGSCRERRCSFAARRARVRRAAGERRGAAHRPRASGHPSRHRERLRPRTHPAQTEGVVRIDRRAQVAVVPRVEWPRAARLLLGQEGAAGEADSALDGSEGAPLQGDGSGVGRGCRPRPGAGGGTSSSQRAPGRGGGGGPARSRFRQRRRLPR